MNQLFPVQVLDPPEVFLGGFDTTRNPRALSAGVGVVCDDIELRRGRFEPRPDPVRIRMPSGDESLIYSGADSRLFAALPSVRGDVVLFAENRLDVRTGRLVVAGGLVIRGQDIPNCGFRESVELRGDGGELLTQRAEPMEYGEFGNTIYVVNCGVASGGDFGPQNATYEIDLRDLKAKLTDWPKARRIANVMGYAALGDVLDRGPRAIVASTLPLVAETPEFDQVFVEVPGDPDDRVMKIIYFPPGGTYVFLKRALWRLFNAPPMWGQEKILDVGTLAPETVRVLDGYIYFLGHDGMPYRTTGKPREVERLGAFDRQGRMLSLDLRSPIETMIRRDYHLAGGGDKGVYIWDSRPGFDRGVVSGGVDPDLEYDNGLRLATDTFDVARVFGGRDNHLPAGIPFEALGDEAWQSWRAGEFAQPDSNGFSLTTIGFRVKAEVTGTYEIRCSLYEHINDSTPSLDLIPIKTIVLSKTYTANQTSELEFDFGGEPLEWDGPTPKQYRVGLYLRNAPGNLYWLWSAIVYNYGRGSRSNHNASFNYSFQVRGRLFRTSGNWRSETTEDVGVTKWGTVNWRDNVVEDELPDEVRIRKVSILGFTASGDPAGVVDSVANGQSLDGLLNEDAVRVAAQVYFNTEPPYRHLSPKLYGLYVHYETGTQTPNAEPTALTWDGRYCLNLLHRTDVVRVDGADRPTRDTFVWDREAWSRWRGLGIMKGDVLYDEFNHPRLVYADMLESIEGVYRILLLDQRRRTWRGARPRFQTGDIRLASRWTGMIDEVQVDYTDLGQPGKLYIALQLDNGQWYAHNLDLFGDNKSHTSVLEPAVREGRILRVVIGENKVIGRSGDRQIPVIVDGLVLVARGAVPRYGIRDTGDRRSAET